MKRDQGVQHLSRDLAHSAEGIIALITPERITSAVRSHRIHCAPRVTAKPRIGVAALNRTAAKRALGDEEIRIIRPTVTRCTQKARLHGPVSSDVIFTKRCAANMRRGDDTTTRCQSRPSCSASKRRYRNGRFEDGVTTPRAGNRVRHRRQGQGGPGAMEHALRLAAKFAAARASKLQRTRWQQHEARNDASNNSSRKRKMNQPARSISGSRHGIGCSSSALHAATLRERTLTGPSA